MLNSSKLHEFFNKRDEMIWVNCFFNIGRMIRVCIKIKRYGSRFVVWPVFSCN